MKGERSDVCAPDGSPAYGGGGKRDALRKAFAGHGAGRVAAQGDRRLAQRPDFGFVALARVQVDQLVDEGRAVRLGPVFGQDLRVAADGVCVFGDD